MSRIIYCIYGGCYNYSEYVLLGQYLPWDLPAQYGGRDGSGAPQDSLKVVTHGGIDGSTSKLVIIRVCVEPVSKRAHVSQRPRLCFSKLSL